MNIEEIVKQGDVIGKILNDTKSIFTFSEHQKNNYLSFLEEDDYSKEMADFYIEVLRRWNSYTPIVADDYHISKGGGYYLKAGGYGIVIDPGFNFIDNFKGAKHKFHEIDVVIISHAHNDHTADLESILTLLYKYNEDIKINENPAGTSIRNKLKEKKNSFWR